MALYKERSHTTTLDRHIPLLKSGAFEHILLGDSIFERLTYERGNKDFFDTIKTKCAVLGVGGDKVENLLYRLLDLQLLNYATGVSTVTILIGTNNIEQHTPTYIYDLIEKVTNHIHTVLPSVKVNIIGVLPRRSTRKNLTDAELNRKIRHLNEQLSTNDNYSECTISLDESNFIDHVHLSTRGYSYLIDHLKMLLNI